MRPTPVWIAATAGLIVVGALTTPGVLVSLVLLVLGFDVQKRLLSILGIVCLPLFLALHYYQLDLTLLQKSIALVCAGLALLLVREFISRMPARSASPA